jgi:AraC family transcriptional regulator
MNYIKVMDDAVDYIENNLDRDIRLEEIAERYYLSPMHFYRIFRAVLNRSLKSYIDTRRLTRAAEAIRSTDQSILHIALEHGYGSHETFTRNFSKWFGVSPSYARKGSVPLSLYHRPQLVERDFKNVNKDVIVSFTNCYLGEVRLFGKELQFSPDSAASLQMVSDFVGDFVSEWVTPFVKERLYSVTRNNMIYPNEEIVYFTGFEASVHPDKLVEKELLQLDIPASRYAVFRYKKDMGNVFETAINDVYRAISVSDLELNSIGIDFMEVYERDYEKSGTFSIYVPIRL